MKKIIAVILALTCVFAFASCDESEGAGNGIENFVKMYSVSEPTKVVTTYVTKLGNVEFDGSSTLVTGTINGKEATVYTYEYKTLQSVEYGAGEEITPIWGETVKGSREYLEDKGERTDGGSWYEGFNFAPTAGSISISLREDNLKNVSYNVNGKIHTLSFTVEAAKCSAVFGEGYEIGSDAQVTVTGDGAVVTGITVTYIAPLVSENEEVVYPNAQITISTSYTYVLEEITLVK